MANSSATKSIKIGQMINGTQLLVTAKIVSNAADTHLTRKVWLGIISAIGIGATIHNSTINCH